jgi:hypothetical protein
MRSKRQVATVDQCGRGRKVDRQVDRQVRSMMRQLSVRVKSQVQLSGEQLKKGRRLVVAKAGQENSRMRGSMKEKGQIR